MTRAPAPKGKTWSAALQARMDDQARFDHAAFERFKAEHAGKTPLEVLAERYPEVYFPNGQARPVKKP